ncbi:MAG: hypothetical protein SWH68_09910 [Thermodesulfobacteriota bacterium]|nr:hypothetical protein [Thermodesulfobacteriota bacterium]
MALDEPRDTDNVYEIGDYKFIVDKAFMEQAKPVKVDFTKFGFAISSSIELTPQDGCSSCGTSGSCC